MTLKCSGYVEENRTCKHGFWTSAMCNPLSAWRLDELAKRYPPQCCNEDWSARAFDATGGKPGERV